MIGRLLCRLGRHLDWIIAVHGLPWGPMSYTVQCSRCKRVR